MAIVSYILGDCPGCGAKNTFGNIDVYSYTVSLGCGVCSYKERRHLPPVKKKVLYLDQFFFSHAVRGNDTQFTEAVERIKRLADLQLLNVPYSSVHEDETHQWAQHEELLQFIKRTSRGYAFEPSYTVEETQLGKAIDAWIAGAPAEYVRERRDVMRDELDVWDGYYFIDVGGYHGDIELVRNLKGQAIEGLVDLFPGWRTSTNTFEQDVLLEHNAAITGYCEAYLTYITRMLKGDVVAELDSPIMSSVIPHLTYHFPPEEPKKGRVKKVLDFMQSEHFRNTPYHDIQARMYATLKSMVRGGAYQNREKSIQRLSGFYYDVKHISTYAPYCDAFLMDNAMAEIVNRDTVGLQHRYGVRVFCRNNWNEFIDWLDMLEGEITQEHRDALPVAYPRMRVE